MIYDEGKPRDCSSNHKVDEKELPNLQEMRKLKAAKAAHPKCGRCAEWQWEDEYCTLLLIHREEYQYCSEWEAKE